MTLDEQILELPPKLEQILNKLKWLKVETRIVRGNICQLLLYYDQIEEQYDGTPVSKLLRPKVYVVELTAKGDFQNEYEVILDLEKL